MFDVGMWVNPGCKFKLAGITNVGTAVHSTNRTEAAKWARDINGVLRAYICALIVHHHIGMILPDGFAN
jgi:hypothetical protein